MTVSSSFVSHQPVNMLLIVLTLLSGINSYSSSVQCTASTSYYDPVTLQCIPCPVSTIRSSLNYCNCSLSYYPNSQVIGFNASDSCLSLAALMTANTIPTVSLPYDSSVYTLVLYDVDGTYAPSLQTCDSTARPSASQYQCVPCGINQVFSSTYKSCRCDSTMFLYQIYGVCLKDNKKILTNQPRQFTIAALADYLSEQIVVVGCQQYNIQQACQHLINKCVDVEYLTSNYFCTKAKQLSTDSTLTNLPKLTFDSLSKMGSLNIYASAAQFVNSTTVKHTLSFLLAVYKLDGTFMSFRPFIKQDFPCPMSDQDVQAFVSFGLNLYKYCSNSTNNNQYTTNYFYELYVTNAQGKLAEIPVTINQQTYKRFTFKNKNVFRMNYITQPPLLVPTLTLSKETNVYIATNSQPSTSEFTLLPPFAIFNIGILIVFILRFGRYIRYNPQDPNNPYFCCLRGFSMFVHMIDSWGPGLWLWLISLSGFMFFFFKFQQVVYLLLPPQGEYWNVYYGPFMIVFYIQSLFVALGVAHLTYRLSSVDYFLLDWERGKEVNRLDVGGSRRQASVWRRILLTNELYELTVHRLVNPQLSCLLSLLFLKGTNWLDMALAIPSVSAPPNVSQPQVNVLLAFFLVAGIMAVVSLVQYGMVSRQGYPLQYYNMIHLNTVPSMNQTYLPDVVSSASLDIP